MAYSFFSFAYIGQNTSRECLISFNVVRQFLKVFNMCSCVCCRHTTEAGNKNENLALGLKNTPCGSYRCAVVCTVHCVTLCVSSADRFPIHKGTLLASSYEVQAFLGEGGFGKVAKCMDVVTNTKVAIKITKDDPYLTERAMEEVEHKLFIY